MAGIMVVGDALLDVHAVPAEPIRPGGDVPATVRLGVGGQGANLAVRLARRGLPVGLACAVGDDAAGPLVRDALYRAGVTIAPIPARTTGSVVIVLDERGERTMLSDRVAFRPAAAARLPELSATAGWLVVSGYLLEEPGAPLDGPALGPARRMLVGCPFRDVEAWRLGLDALDPHLLVVNRAEAAALVAANETSTPAELAAALAAAGVAGTVVVTHTDGAAGASGSPASVIEIAVEPAADVVDTTGAGDAFAATLLAALHGEWPPAPEVLREAMERAARVATAVTRTVGAQAVVGDERPTELRR
jgi:sugar/nucleoside kinase (ribokinase family)